LPENGGRELPDSSHDTVEAIPGRLTKDLNASRITCPMSDDNITLKHGLLTVKEVAELINCKPSTVYAWAKRGEIPSFKLNGLLRFEARRVHAKVLNI
jgi:excisionase family DNA binding protein